MTADQAQGGQAGGQTAMSREDHGCDRMDDQMKTVSDLVAGSGFGFEDRGEHQLKGIPDAWLLFALVRA